MKKNLLNPAKWILASLTGLVIALNPGVMQAQDKKEVKKTIMINNGDTIINGKNLKEVSKSERKKLLKELNDVKGVNRIEVNTDAKGEGNVVIIRKKKDGEPEQVIVKTMKIPHGMAWKDGEMHAFGPNGPMPPHVKIEMDSLMFKMEGDSAFKEMRIRMKDLRDKMPQGFKDFDGDENFEFFVYPDDGPRASVFPAPNGFRRAEKNSQSFSYNNVDKDGISNRLNIRLSEAGKDALKKITGSENAKTDLDVQDLSFFPSFSTGKLNLAFSLKTKAAIEVKILDSDFAVVLNDKQANLNESYYKSFSLPKNGVYYLTIAQNGNWFIKRLIKE